MDDSGVPAEIHWPFLPNVRGDLLREEIRQLCRVQGREVLTNTRHNPTEQ
jgi:hypothetical protein